MRKTLRQAMMDGVHFLQSHQIEDAISDGRIIFEAAFSIDRTHYLLNGDQEADPDRERVYQQYLRQRVQGKPVQYIIEGQEFMGLSFYVDPRVLIPRQDTETLVEAVLSDMEEQKITLKAADIGTGSGCIAVSIAAFRKEAVQMTATDLSAGALQVAEVNARRNDVSLRLLQGNLLEALPEEEKRTWHYIISNPPYISDRDMQNLERNVREFEPRLALSGGEDGLKYYRELGVQAKDHLRPGGQLWLEIGWDQGSSVSQILAQEGYQNVQIRKDLAGHDRVVSASYLGIEKDRGENRV